MSKHKTHQSYLTDRLDELQMFLSQECPPKREILLGQRIATKIILDHFNDTFKDEINEEKK